MCRRAEAQAAQDAAAELLERACTTRFCTNDLSNPVTVDLLPPAPADFADLLRKIDRRPRRPRNKH